jgi:hypothetical protein
MLSGELEAVAQAATPSNDDTCPTCGSWRGPTWFWLQCAAATLQGRQCERSSVLHDAWRRRHDDRWAAARRRRSRLLLTAPAVDPGTCRVLRTRMHTFAYASIDRGDEFDMMNRMVATATGATGASPRATVGWYVPPAGGWSYTPTPGSVSDCERLGGRMRMERSGEVEGLRHGVERTIVLPSESVESRCRAAGLSLSSRNDCHAAQRLERARLLRYGVACRGVRRERVRAAMTMFPFRS